MDDRDINHLEVAPSLSQAQFLRFAIDALAYRVVRWVAILMSFGLFTYCVIRPDWIRLASAATFAVLVYLPLVLRKDR